MQSPTAPGHEPTQSTSPPGSPITAMSPGSPSSAEASDPLVVEMAQSIADVINDFKRKLDTRDGDWANVHGQIELALEWQNYILSVQPDEFGDEYPIKITAKIKADTDEPLSHHSSRHESDTNLESNLALQKKRRSDGDGDASKKRQRTAGEDQATVSVITKEDLNELLFELRDETQDDTSECVNHVQRLLQRFNQEPHTAIVPDDDDEQPQARAPVYSSMPSGSIPVPSPTETRDSTTTTFLAGVVRSEAKLLSSQIKWVEDCRRLASDSQIQREETWRTSSAGFHDRARQNREDFQNTILHQQGAQAQTLQQILNEVKAFALYAQSCKWEVPGEVPGRGMGMAQSNQMTPVNVGRSGATPSMGQQMFSYLPNAPGRGSASGGGSALPPFPR